ncbi:MAG: hypothetical protein ABSB71_12970 [Candidatus Bathyarchaeia archaeon]|jgi:hypothetical protein
MSVDDDLNRKHDCLRCKHIFCTNFYRKGKKNFEGGESYVLKELIKEKVVLPCNISSMIYTTCQLLSSLWPSLSTYLFIQSVRDLKASAYLLLSCHYRSSIQLLRPIVENCVAGLYWDAKYGLANEDKRELVEQQFSQFLEDKYEIPFPEWKYVFPNEDESKRKKKLDYDYCLSWMAKDERTIIGGESKQEISKLIGELNKYLHPSGLKRMEIGKENCPDCPSWVRYEKEEYERCTRLFQDVTALLIQVFYTYLESRLLDKMQSKAVLNAISYIKSLEYLEKELKTKLIFSEQLKTFLSKKEFSELA